MQYVTAEASKLVRNSAALVVGLHISAGSGATVVELFDGLNDSGVSVLKLYIADDTHENFSIGEGIPFNTGVYYKVVSGTAAGSIFVE